MFCHIDADAFFASVLVLSHPHLAGKPLAALGAGGTCVIAASYEAKACGVLTGMRLSEAKRLCPGLQSLPTDFAGAVEASRAIRTILGERSPFIEQASIDEWYIDLTTIIGGIPPDLGQWAKELQQTILRRTGLNVTLGIAASKTLAKMAAKERKPKGIGIILESEREDFLRRRAIDAIPGIGKKRMVFARGRGWMTAWDFVRSNEKQVLEAFGKTGLELHWELRGTQVYTIARDKRPPQSISRCRSFPRTTDRAIPWNHLLDHLAATVSTLRHHSLACKTIGVWLRTTRNGSIATEERSPNTLHTEEAILPLLQRCFAALWKNSSTMQAGLALRDFSPYAIHQGNLFEDRRKEEESENLQRALDQIRQRYGRKCVGRGATNNLASTRRVPEHA